MKTLNQYIMLLALLCAALASTGCEKYLKADEDSAFVVSVSVDNVPAGNVVPVAVILSEGVKTGACTAVFSVVSKADGSSPAFSVLSGDGTTMDTSTRWSFSSDGIVRFRLSGIPAGSYTLGVTVTRWFHTAAATASFTVNQ